MFLDGLALATRARQPTCHRALVITKGHDDRLLRNRPLSQG
jgi:hypothetical protein